MSTPKIHLADQGRTLPYCWTTRMAGKAITLTHALNETTCKTCINLATIGRR